MRVYLAGPISRPDGGTGQSAENVRRVIALADVLMARGHAPFVPHLSVFWQYISGPKSHEAWLAMDSQWIPVCDALMRVLGESPGADEEEALAKKLGIPVTYVTRDLTTLQLNALVGRMEVEAGKAAKNRAEIWEWREA